MAAPRFRIGALLPIGPEYSGRLLEGAIQCAQEYHDIELLDLGYVRDDSGEEFPTAIGLDGALVWLRQNDEWANELRRQGTVVINASADRPASEVPHVVFDRSSVVRRAVEYLGRLNRHHSLFVGCAISPVAALSSRAEMFVDLFREQGRQAEVLELGETDGVENRTVQLSCKQQRILTRTLQQLKGPAAIWCEDDSLARIVCDTAQGIGLSVPGDVAVLGFGDYRIARAGRPLISTVPMPGQLIGSRAVKRIAQILKGQVDPAECVLVPAPGVLIRESTESFSLDETAYHRVLTMIRSRACEGLTVKDLIPWLPHSQRTFSRRFHELYGCTPGAMIRKVRLERAREYLRATDFSVARIAELCGFEESGKFSAFFKRETGMTPSMFRESGGGRADTT